MFNFRNLWLLFFFSTAVYSLEKKDFVKLLNRSIEVHASKTPSLLLTTYKKNGSLDQYPTDYNTFRNYFRSQITWDSSYSKAAPVNKIDWTSNPHGLNDDVAITIEGYFYNTTIADWQFRVSASAAFELRVDNVAATSHYADSAKVESSPLQRLPVGWHHLSLKYIKGAQGFDCALSYKKGTSRGWLTVSSSNLRLRHLGLSDRWLLTMAKSNGVTVSTTEEELLLVASQKNRSDVGWYHWTLEDALSFSGNKQGYNPEHNQGCVATVEGYFLVEPNAAGLWRFGLNSLGSASIKIDDSVVTSWYGDHGMEQAGVWSHTGSVTLASGWHKLVVDVESLANSIELNCAFQSPLKPSWTPFSKDELTVKSNALDVDRDGLANDLEAVLSTDWGVYDSDKDFLGDFYELSISSDPLKVDSNGDGLSDFDERFTGAFQPLSTQDVDADGLVNMDDFDNDGDGVNDGLDLSPMSKTASKEIQSVEIANAGGFTLVDFQLRPEDASHLALSGKSWDWPTDHSGTMQDTDGSENDVTMIPVLEVTSSLLPNQSLAELYSITLTENGNVGAAKSKFNRYDDFKVADLDGDGLDEIIVAKDVEHEIKITNSSGLNRTFSSTFKRGSRLLVGPVRSGGKMGIVILNQKNIVGVSRLTIDLYDSKGHKKTLTDDVLIAGLRSQISIAGVTLADIDGDGEDEFIVAFLNGSALIKKLVFDPKRGSYALEDMVSGESYSFSFTSDDGFLAGDLDGDGKDELVVVHDADTEAVIFGLDYNGSTVTVSEKYRKSISYAPGRQLAVVDVLPATDAHPDLSGEEIICLWPMGEGSGEDGKVRIHSESGYYDKMCWTNFKAGDGFAVGHVSEENSAQVVTVSGTSGKLEVYSTQFKRAYIPLTPVLDHDKTVAFSGRMVYPSTGRPQAIKSNFRLVWQVMGRTDADEDHLNRSVFLVKYSEPFGFTGLRVKETEEISSAILYSPDADLTPVFEALVDVQINLNQENKPLDEVLNIIEANYGTSLTVVSNTQPSEVEYSTWLETTVRDSVLPTITDGARPIVTTSEHHYFSVNLDSLDHTGSDLLISPSNQSKKIEKQIFMPWFDHNKGVGHPLTVFEITEQIKGLVASEVEQQQLQSISFLAQFGFSTLADDEAPPELSENTKYFTYGSGGVGTMKAVMIASKYKSFCATWNQAINQGSSLWKVNKALGGNMKNLQYASKYAKTGGKALGPAGTVLTAISIGFDAVGVGDAYGGAGAAAYVVVQTAYNGVLFAIASFGGPAGVAVVGVIMVADWVSSHFTENGEGVVSNASMWVAEKFTSDTITMTFVKFTNPKPPGLVIYDFDDNGLDVGDRIEYSAEITSNVTENGRYNRYVRDSHVDNSYIYPRAYFGKSGDGSYRRGDVLFRMSEEEESIYVSSPIDGGSHHKKRITKVYESKAWFEPTQPSAYFHVDLYSQVNYGFYTGKYHSVQKKFDNVDLIKDRNSSKVDRLYFDIMPGNLKQFLNWSLIRDLDKDHDRLATKFESFGSKEAVYDIVSLTVDESQNGLCLAYDGDLKLGTRQSDYDRSTSWALVAVEGLPGFYNIEQPHFTGQRIYALNSSEVSTRSSDRQDSQYTHWQLKFNSNGSYQLINEYYKKALTVASVASGNTEFILTNPEENQAGSYWLLSPTGSSDSDPTLVDSDGDGLSDFFELGYYTETGRLKVDNPDTDGDGLNDFDEILAGSDPTVMDTDGDGLSDLEERNGWLVSYDYKGILTTSRFYSNPNLTDSDNDGLTDYEERQNKNPLNPLSYDTDGDGYDDFIDPNPLNFDNGNGVDYDGDSLTDGVEIAGWDLSITTADGVEERNVSSSIDSTDTDGDHLGDADEYKLSDPTATDTDGDGVLDSDEVSNYTDVLHYDSDGDGLSDANEINAGLNPLSKDSDRDGLEDGDEIQAGTDPLLSDSDGDGLSDGDEVYKYLTDPLVSDTDGDGLSDGKEVNIKTLPTNPDSDGDGILDGVEVNSWQSNPLSKDSDGDGLADNVEGDPVTGSSNPTLVDTDGDSLSDYDEVMIHHTDPRNTNSDDLYHDDFLNDAEEVAIGTDPLKYDTDGDGLFDGEEVKLGTDPLVADTDNDGLSDGEEVKQLNSSPLNPDSDGDGIIDSLDIDTLDLMAHQDEILILFDTFTPAGLTRTGEDFTATVPELTQQAIDDFSAALNLNSHLLVLSGTIADYPNYADYQKIVLLGQPSESPESGSVAALITTIFANVHEDVESRILSVSNLEFDPNNPGTRSDSPLKDSLVLIMNYPYPSDAFLIPTLFNNLQNDFLNNYVNKTEVASFPNKVSSLTIDAISDIGANLSCTFNPDVVLNVSGTLMVFSEKSIPYQDVEVVALEKYRVGKYVESLVIPTELSIPQGQLTYYYHDYDLDRSFPKNQNHSDIGDIDEGSLQLYVFDKDSASWQLASVGANGISQISFDVADQTINDHTFAGKVTVTYAGVNLVVAIVGTPIADSTQPGSPTVSTVFPLEDATDVELEASITMVLSEEIEVIDLNFIALNKNDQFSVSYNSSNRTITLVPTLPLVPERLQVVEIPAGIVKDLAGELNEAYSWSFTTGKANGIPQAMNDHFYCTEDDFSLILDLFADNGYGVDTDSDVDDVLTILYLGDNQASTIGNLGGVFVLTNQLVTFLPGEDFDFMGEGELLTTSVTYTLSDGHGGTSEATVSVEVTGVNDMPTLDSVSLSIEHGVSELRAQPSGWSDLDHDDERYQVSWFVNNLVEQVGEDFIFSLSQVNANDTVRCEMIPMDGYSTGPMKSSANFTFPEWNVTMTTSNEAIAPVSFGVKQSGNTSFNSQLVARPNEFDPVVYFESGLENEVVFQDLRNASTTLEWEFTVQPSDESFTISWQIPDSFTHAKFLSLHEVDELGEVVTGSSVLMQQTNNLEITGDLARKTRHYKIIFGDELQFYLDLRGGWNLFSAPLTEQSSTLYLWGWAEHLYQPTNTVEVGKGYWVRMPTETFSPVLIHSSTLTTLPNLAVNAGWNLVGLPKATALQTSPAVVVWYWDNISKIYKGLKSSEPLKVGTGYWLFSEQPQVINLED